MARTQTRTETSEVAAAAQGELDTGFGAEFRELARQRRFVRDAEQDSDWRSAAAPPKRERAAAAPAPSTPRIAAPSPALSPTPAPTPTPAASTAALRARTAAPLPSGTSLRRAVGDPRISDDQRATLRELARMSDRLVDAREQLASATARAAQLDSELAQARQQLAHGEQRLIASRVLVQDAQRQTHAMAERCAWLEARCETLEDALELAVNASWSTRWKWRREQRARTRAAAGSATEA